MSASKPISDRSNSPAGEISCGTGVTVRMENHTVLLFICSIKCNYCENAKQSAILQNREITPKAVKISGGRDFIDADDSESL